MRPHEAYGVISFLGFAFALFMVAAAPTQAPGAYQAAYVIIFLASTLFAFAAGDHWDAHRRGR